MAISLGLLVGVVVSALFGVFPNLRATGTALNAGASSFPPDANAVALAAGLATTPPMGWNGYNRYYLHVTARMVEAEASALVRTGMKAAGYAYVNIDGGWDLPTRSESGALQPDPARFPDGIKPVADYVHSLGLKFGIYTSAGTMNCAATTAGSYGHYRQDTATFASWGVDYIKFDWCYIPMRSYPHMTERQVSQVLSTEMAGAIAASGRPMLYDVNDAYDKPWTWSVQLAAMWRTSNDIKDHYRSLLYNFQHDVGYHLLARPGHWNDPDMLEIGNGGLSYGEEKAQFSLWAEMAAPLIAGNDVRNMTPLTRSILTNLAVIAVDQDRLGRQGYPVATAGGHWVLTKPLVNGDRAVVLFNATSKQVTISTTVARIGLTGSSTYSLLNLWSGLTSKTSGVITANLPPHSVVMYDVAPLG